MRAGQALAVEGANGAGKTSLLRLIAGFLPPAGRILVSIGMDQRKSTTAKNAAAWSAGWGIRTASNRN